MAQEPEDLTLRLLREVRAQQTAHGEKLDRIEKRVNDLFESVTYTLGLAVTTHRRADVLESRLDDLVRRVEKLERVD